jgi:hypothetical protein
MCRDDAELKQEKASARQRRIGGLDYLLRRTDIDQKDADVH